MLSPFLTEPVKQTSLRKPGRGSLLKRKRKHEEHLAQKKRKAEFIGGPMDESCMCSSFSLFIMQG
jgi:hypothetical protein